MNNNHQFAVSCHILAILAASPEDTVTSEVIALSVDTHPVVIRRILGYLRDNGLVESKAGANGGWKLVPDPSQVSLRGVYQAVGQDFVLNMHQHPNPECPIGGNIQETLKNVFNQAQAAMENALDNFTIQNILTETIKNSEKN